MKKILFISILMGLFFVGFVSAINICIDHIPPSAPSNLAVSGGIGNILLTWDSATDEPSCSGIESYTIKRNNPDNSTILLGIVSTGTLNFIDNSSLAQGSYSYVVYAIDRVGHNTGAAIKNIISINSGGGSYIGGGGGGTSYVCDENWSCGDWSECINNGQRRLCNDLNRCGTVGTKPETSRACGVNQTNKENTTNLNPSEGVNIGTAKGPNGFLSAMTGAVIGAMGTGGTVLTSIFILLVIGGFIFLKVRKKGLKKKRRI